MLEADPHGPLAKQLTEQGCGQAEFLDVHT